MRIDATDETAFYRRKDEPSYENRRDVRTVTKGSTSWKVEGSLGQDDGKKRKTGKAEGEKRRRGRGGRASRRRDCVLMYGWHSDDNRDKLLY